MNSLEDYWDNVLRNLELPKTQLLSVGEIINTYGYMLTEEQIKILKEHEAKT